MTRRKLQAPNFLNKHRRQSGPLIFNIQISKHIHSANLYPENNAILIHCRLKKMQTYEMSNNFETRKYCSSCNLKKGNTLQIVVFPWNDMTNRQTSLSILLKMVNGHGYYSKENSIKIRQFHLENKHDKVSYQESKNRSLFNILYVM